MRNRMYGGVRGRKTRVGEKLHRFPPTRLSFWQLGVCQQYLNPFCIVFVQVFET